MSFKMEIIQTVEKNSKKKNNNNNLTGKFDFQELILRGSLKAIDSIREVENCATNSLFTFMQENNAKFSVKIEFLYRFPSICVIN